MRWCMTPGYVLPMTKTSTAAATLTADQDAALRAMADRIVDFLEAGIERFGDADRFMAAMAAYNAQAGR